VSPTRFMAVMSQKEAEQSFRPGSTATAVVSAERTAEPALLWLAEITQEDQRQKLGPLLAQPEAACFHAGLLRASRDGPLLLLSGPPGVLRVHETERYRSGQVVLSRLDLEGRVLWQRDLGLSRLEQILPDAALPAFVGTRSAQPSKVPEPILVVVDAQTGAATTHSLLVKD